MKRYRKFYRSVEASVEGRNTILTASASAAAYILLVVFSFPTYTFQLLGQSIYYLPEIMRMSTLNVIDTQGMVGLFLTIIYALLTGILLTNIYLSFNPRPLSGAMDFGAFLPGFLVSGCASCGVGILTVLGFSGIALALPFSGNLVLASGIAIMVFLIQRTGDPRTCSTS